MTPKKLILFILTFSAGRKCNVQMNRINLTGYAIHSEVAPWCRWDGENEIGTKSYGTSIVPRCHFIKTENTKVSIHYRLFLSISSIRSSRLLSVFGLLGCPLSCPLQL